MSNTMLAYLIDIFFVIMGAVCIAYDPNNAAWGGAILGFAAMDILVMGNNVGVESEAVRS